MTNQQRERKIRQIARRLARASDSAERSALFQHMRLLIASRPADFVARMERRKGLQ